MNKEDETRYIRLAEKRGWRIIKNPPAALRGCPYFVEVEGRIIPLNHPYTIHLWLYRNATDPETCFVHMRAVHDILWPHYVPTWNEWEERRFRAHCECFAQIVLAGGASTGKSLTAAKIALIWWLSNPTKHACVVASTTLESLESRIWGYVIKLAAETALPINAKILTGKPPKLLCPDIHDKIHGMFAIAVRAGEEKKVLSTIIGRHPDKGIMVVLDEATEISSDIMAALPNLEQGVEFCQLIAIGNSDSKHDLHGALATPKHGWDSVSWETHKSWETTHKNGICLYFNPFDSPAITEKDPIKRARLAKFLITKEQIEEKKSTYGEFSSSFYRFVLGFWPSRSNESVLASEAFLTEQEVYKFAEWSGFQPLRVVAGLDPAWHIGGKGCVLRMAVIGQTTSGLMALDFRKEELLFRIDIHASGAQSSELQMCDSILRILRQYNCPLRMLAVDTSGSGRALPELLRLRSGEIEGPMKIVSAGRMNTLAAKKDDPGMFISSPTDMWFQFREFIQHGQIKGLDFNTIRQLCTRLLVPHKAKGGIMLIERKPDYIARMSAVDPKFARSPDEADSAILAMMAAYWRAGVRVGQRMAIPTARDELWFQKAYVFNKEQEAKRGVNAIGEKAVPTRPQLKASFSAPPVGLENFRLVREE